MKTILRIGFAVTVAALLFVAWHTYRAAEADSSPFSQIYIHGTPVCVFKEGEQVLARIGNCPNMPGAGGESAPRAAPYRNDPSPKLPPGHPPINEDPFPDRQRTISI